MCSYVDPDVIVFDLLDRKFVDVKESSGNIGRTAKLLEDVGVTGRRRVRRVRSVKERRL